MINVLAVIGAVAIGYFIVLGILNHFDKKKELSTKDGN